MVKVCLKSTQALGLGILFSLLAACGGQATKPDSVDLGADKEESTKLAPEVKTQEASDSSMAKETKSVETVSSAEISQAKEEPVVEVMPGKTAAEADIAVEPIPAMQTGGESVSSASAADAQEQQQEAVAASGKEVKPVAAVSAAAKEKPMSPDSAMEEQTLPAGAVESLPVSSGPNHFVITVGPKSQEHPAYGKGHALGFAVNGVSGQELVLERGKTYIFDIRTGPKHDVYISSKEIGWGSAPIAEGVENAFIYNGRMTFTPSDSTPDKVYYACRNHPHMGAMIHIVNPGETVAIKERKATSVSHDKMSTTPSVSESQAKQKVMFAEMLINGQGAKRVQASSNDDAKKMLTEAKDLLVEGKAKLKTGDAVGAFGLADRSLKMIGEATRLVPSEEAQAQLVETYKSLLAEISDYESSYKANYEKLAKADAMPEGAKLDEKKYADLKADAAELASKGNYVQANEQLQQAQKVITAALHKMLDSKTIVFELNFDTPEDEYKYELKRFIGYEELIPVAIEAKKPAPGALKLMESFVEKARKRRDEAVAKAAEKDFSSAIAMMQQATQTVQRALRMVGVTQ